MLKLLAVSILVIGLVYYWFFNNRKMRTYKHYMKRRKMFEESVADFQADEKYINQNLALAINYKEEKLFVSFMKNGLLNSYISQFDNISGIEILEDNIAVKTGLSGYNLNINTTKDFPGIADPGGKGSGINDHLLKDSKINRIDLKIFFKDSHNPSVLANFLFWEVSRESRDYREMFNDVMRWYEIICKIIK